MLPKTKKHLTQKCEGYKTTSTQFRQHGRKAYIRGYMHGFCHKSNMFTDDGRPSTLDFMPFVEIMDVDWVSASASSDGNQNVPATPKKFAKPDVTNSKGKRKIAFDPFADSRGLITSSLSSEDKAQIQCDEASAKTCLAPFIIIKSCLAVLAEASTQGLREVAAPPAKAQPAPHHLRS
jgi:hypothetical protein